MLVSGNDMWMYYTCHVILVVFDVPWDCPGQKIFWTQISVLLFLFQALNRPGGRGQPSWGCVHNGWCFWQRCPIKWFVYMHSHMEKDGSIASCLGPSFLELTISALKQQKSAWTNANISTSVQVLDAVLLPLCREFSLALRGALEGNASACNSFSASTFWQNYDTKQMAQSTQLLSSVGDRFYGKQHFLESPWARTNTRHDMIHVQRPC